MKLLFTSIMIVILGINNIVYAQSIAKDQYNQLNITHNICNQRNVNSCSISEKSKFLYIVNKQNNPIFDYIFELQNNYEQSYSLYNNTCKKYEAKDPKYMECFQKFRQHLLPIFKSINALPSSFKSNSNKKTIKNGFLKEYRYYLLDLININENFQLSNTKNNEYLKMTTKQLLQDPYVDYLIISLVQQQQEQLLNDFAEQEQLKENVNNYFKELIEETKTIKNQLIQLRKIHNPNGI